MNLIAVIGGIVLCAAGLFGNFFVDDEAKKLRKPSIAAIIAGVIIIILSQTIVIIPTNNTGVRTTFGQINENTLSDGLQFKIPFIQRVEKVNNKQQDVVVGEEQIWSETTERTPLWYKTITVTFQINPEKSAWIYANITNYESNLISEDIVSSAIKSCSKKLPDNQATDRNIIEPLVASAVQESVNQKYGENVVLIQKILVKDADFEESYNNAIAEKQNAQIAYEKQQIENKKLIETKEAEAAAKIKEAEGEAEANKLIQNSISKEVLQSKMLDKWNGELPKAVSDNSSFLLDIFNNQ